MPRPLRTIPWVEIRNGCHYVSWYTPPADPKAKGRTERYSLRTRDAAEAQARYAAFLIEGGRFSTRETLKNVLTVERALDQYFAEHVAFKVVSKSRQEAAIRHLKAHFSDLALTEIDVLTCRGYAAARRAGTIGGARKNGKTAIGCDSTIARELGVLKAAAYHAVLWKRLTTDKMPTFELPIGPERDDEAMFLTKAELLTTLRKAEGTLKTFIAIAYWTGSRRNAIETLTLAQIDMDRNRVNLSKPGEVKTKKRRPIVPIYRRAKPYFARQIAEAKAAGRDTLFSRGVDFYWPFKGLCTRLGFGDKGFPHILRHSRATHMLMDGESIYKVAKLLGDTMVTAEKKYGHASVEFLAETRRK